MLGGFRPNLTTVDFGRSWAGLDHICRDVGESLATPGGSVRAKAGSPRWWGVRGRNRVERQSSMAIPRMGCAHVQRERRGPHHWPPVLATCVGEAAPVCPALFVSTAAEVAVARGMPLMPVIDVVYVSALCRGAGGDFG